METITFYSYKGGVGRTLALANVAIYLSRFGLNVCIMDFDLEAPGLHYKFPDLIKTSDLKVGLVDYIYNFTQHSSTSKSLRDYTVEIIPSSRNQGKIDLIPAGNVLSPSYWQKLASIDWHHLFYSDHGEGIPLFFDLKEKIKKQLNPDFLLIDSRTGITEMSGLCTSLLADKVVFLFTNNQENIDGAAQIIHSIRQSTMSPRCEAIKIVCALTRIPMPKDDEDNKNKEQEIIQKIQSILNLKNPSKISEFYDICVLHSDRDLELSESLRINQNGLAKDVPLLRDYLRLFSKIISNDIISPRLDIILNEIVDNANLLDDPEKAQIELEGLVSSYLHPKSLEKLIDLYILRKEDLEKTMEAFRTLTETYGIDNQKTLNKYITLFKNTDSDYTRAELFDTKIIEDYLGSSPKDSLIELMLADTYKEREDFELAIRHYSNLLFDNNSDRQIVLNNMMDIYLDEDLREEGMTLYKKYFSIFESNKDLRIKAIRILLKLGNIVELSKLIEDKTTENELFVESPSLYGRIMALLGRDNDLKSKMDLELDRAIISSNPDRVHSIGKLFYEMGESDEFDKKTLGKVRDREEILISLKRYYGSRRLRKY